MSFDDIFAFFEVHTKSEKFPEHTIGKSLPHKPPKFDPRRVTRGAATWQWALPELSQLVGPTPLTWRHLIGPRGNLTR